MLYTIRIRAIRQDLVWYRAFSACHRGQYFFSSSAFVCANLRLTFLQLVFAEISEYHCGFPKGTVFQLENS